MRVSVGRSCCNVESRHATLKCSKVERQTNVYKKQILQESLSRSFLVIIFTHLETPSLLMVFTLIVPLSVMMREDPNVLHLFLTSKRNFLVSKESDSFIIFTNESLSFDTEKFLFAKSKIFSAFFFFQVIFVSK